MEKPVERTGRRWFSQFGPVAGLESWTGLVQHGLGLLAGWPFGLSCCRIVGDKYVSDPEKLAHAGPNNLAPDQWHGDCLRLMSTIYGLPEWISHGWRKLPFL